MSARTKRQQRTIDRRNARPFTICYPDGTEVHYPGRKAHK